MWANVGAELVTHFLAPLGTPVPYQSSSEGSLDGCGKRKASNDCSDSSSGPIPDVERPCLTHIQTVYSVALVCKEWSRPTFRCIEGLLVTPISDRYVPRLRPPALEDRNRQVPDQVRLRMQATADHLAWLLPRFPRLRALALTGWQSGSSSGSILGPTLGPRQGWQEAGTVVGNEQGQQRLGLGNGQGRGGGRGGGGGGAARVAEAGEQHEGSTRKTFGAVGMAERRLSLEIACSQSWRPPEVPIYDPWPRISDALVRELARCCPKLEWLPCCRFDPAAFTIRGLRFLSKEFQQMRELNLHGFHLSHSLVERWIAAMAMMPHLRSLNVSRMRCVTDDVLIQLAKSCPNIQDLSLHDTRVRDKGVRFLAQGHLPHLTSLGLGALRIGRAALSELLTSAIMANIEALELFNHRLHSADLQTLVKNCPKLAWISLESDYLDPRFTPEELGQFLEALGCRLKGVRLGPVFSNRIAKTIGESCPSLVQLSVGGVGRGEFNDIGLRAILTGCPSLQALDIACCDGLSLYARRWGTGPQKFAALLRDLGQSLRWVCVHGCTFRALALLRSTLPLAHFEHDGYVEAHEVDYKDFYLQDQGPDYLGESSDDSFSTFGSDSEEEEDEDGGLNFGDWLGGAFWRGAHGGQAFDRPLAPWLLPSGGRGPPVRPRPRSSSSVRRATPKAKSSAGRSKAHAKANPKAKVKAKAKGKAKAKAKAQAKASPKGRAKSKAKARP